MASLYKVSDHYKGDHYKQVGDPQMGMMNNQILVIIGIPTILPILIGLGHAPAQAQTRLPASAVLISQCPALTLPNLTLPSVPTLADVFPPLVPPSLDLSATFPSISQPSFPTITAPSLPTATLPSLPTLSLPGLSSLSIPSLTLPTAALNIDAASFLPALPALPSPSLGLDPCSGLSISG